MFYVFHVRRFPVSIGSKPIASRPCGSNYFHRRSYTSKPPDEGPAFGRYFLLIIPFTTFNLGCWQWRRHKWKTNIINGIYKGIQQPAIELPIDNLKLLDQMEYRKVHVKGTYLYDKQFVVLSRGRFDQGNKGDLQTNDGAHVYTPLQVEGINLVIIVNRGWIPVEKIDYENGLGKERKPTRTELTGVVRKSEKPNPWLSNEPEEGIWVYKDVQQMADLCNASPILIDADYESTVPGGPIGGQTNINLRNEHFNYMLQWFGLSFISTMMWLAQIKVKLR